MKRKSLSPDDRAPLAGDRRQRYQALKELGDRHAAESEPRRARECYNQAASIAPGEPGPYVGLGVLAIQDGRLDEAERAFRIARRIRPDCPEANTALAMIHQHRGEYDAALEAYLKCLRLDADNLIALLGLFQTSCQMGTFSQIIHYLQVYLDKHPGDASVLFCLASLHAREGRLVRARELLRDVLALEPGKAEAGELLAEVERRLAGAPAPGEARP